MSLAATNSEALKTERLPRREPIMDSGVLVIDKPAGISSMDVIRELRKIAFVPKIGHGGTLDPFATGVLPILLNNATKLSERIMGGMKAYEGSFFLGQAYDTQDMTGKPLHDLLPIPADLTIDQVQTTARIYQGEIMQEPPQYSAIKRAGKPLYEYARAGQKVELEKRPVYVKSFEILERLDERRFKFRVVSAKGVYVRSLIHDLGQSLGCGAVTESLRRTQAGPYSIEEALKLDTLRYPADIRLHLKAISAL